MSGEPASQSVEARLRAVVASLTERLDAALAALEAERGRLQGLRIAELERRLNSDTSDSGTPSSKESIGAKAARATPRHQGLDRSGSDIPATFR